MSREITMTYTFDDETLALLSRRWGIDTEEFSNEGLAYFIGESVDNRLNDFIEDEAEDY